jgi:hypothetical protein
MRVCKNCGGPVNYTGGLAYCSTTCWDKAARRRRPLAAARSRARRAAIAANASTTIDTEGDWIVTRVWRDGRLQSEGREPVA